jgi:hypothetical protein
MLLKLHIDQGSFKDETGRIVILRGINVAGDCKFPAKHRSSDPDLVVVDSDGLSDSYVGTPFPLDEADEHFSRLKSYGFNTVRYLFTWDALEHKAPGEYDEEYISFTIEMLKKLGQHGLICFMDPHQDTWSRFSGGSGAPLWTFYAAGLEPSHFNNTHAAVVQEGDMAPVQKMIWASNYHRLACQVMFTVFFAGEDFAPKCNINGINVGKYLRSKYLNAVEHFARRVYDVPELREVVIGWESLNEPGHGLIGYQDITTLPTAHEHVKLGTSPTPYQGMLLGCGIPQTVEVYTFTAMGTKRQGTTLVSPTDSAWLTPEKAQAVDAKYAWTRDWRPGCIWKLHGVYNDEHVLRRDYFTFDRNGKPLDDRAFVEEYFVNHWLEYHRMIRSISNDWFVFMQTPVNNKPPNLRGKGIEADNLTVYTPHYYDGLTLMLKKWRRMFNVDGIGIMRNNYVNPVFGLRLGERAIRASLCGQLRYIKSEGKQLVGEHVPCLVSEIGIPYDLDDKRAYETGDYTSQIKAMDANHNALEQSQLHHTLWVYTACSTHAHGDFWNGEDLSIWSKDDKDKGLDGGLRAAEAVIRPYPAAVTGRIISYGFDLQNVKFSLKLHCTDPGITEIFVPTFHYPVDQTGVSTSSGTWELKDEKLVWNHSKGMQTIHIRGAARAQKGDSGCVVM